MKWNLFSVKNLTLLASTFVFSTAFAEKKIGLVLDKGGKDDKSFNASAYAGLMKAKNDLKVETKYVESPDDNAIEVQLDAFAKKKFDLVVGIGFVQQEAVAKVAKKYPNVKFAIVDAKVDAPNVQSLLFMEHEGSFLVGAAAAMVSKTGKVGFIGGMDIPLIRRFQVGYEAGVKHINPKASITSNYVGVTGSAWKDPGKGKELALSQYNNGVDVIYGAAGGSGMGIFDAAEEQKKFAIGVDSNQNWIKPGRILTSMEKRVNVAVYEAIKEIVDGKFTAGTKTFGLGNGGIDFSVDENNKEILPKEMVGKLNEIKKQIIAGKINVPDFFKQSPTK